MTGTESSLEEQVVRYLLDQHDPRCRDAAYYLQQGNPAPAYDELGKYVGIEANSGGDWERVLVLMEALGVRYGLPHQTLS